MVILNKQIDGLGNQLLLTAHFIANAAAYGYELAIPNFDAYKNLFEGTAGPAPGAAEAAEVRLNLAPQVGGLGLLSRMLQRRWTLPLLQRLPGGVHLAGWHIMGADDEAGHDLNAPAFEHVG